MLNGKPQSYEYESATSLNVEASELSVPACRSLSVRPLRHNSQGGLWHSDVSGTNLCLALLKLSLFTSNRQLMAVAYTQPSLKPSRNPNSSSNHRSRTSPLPQSWRIYRPKAGRQRGLYRTSVPGLAQGRRDTESLLQKHHHKTCFQPEMDQRSLQLLAP